MEKLGNFTPDFPLQLDLFDNKKKVLLDFDSIFLNENVLKWRLSPGVFLVKSENSSELIISGPSVKLSKKSERLVVKDRDDYFCEIPFFRLSHIHIQSLGVSLSSDVINECSRRDIHITFTTYGGRPYAMLSSPYLNAVVKTRREQIKAYYTEKGVRICKEIVRGKLQNQMNTLKYSIKNINKSERIFNEVFSKIKEINENLKVIDNVNGDNCDDVRIPLMNIEALSAQKYWDSFKMIIENKITFPGRIKRGAVDGVNSLLNYGYGMLYSVVWGCILNAGLEPFAGFLHVDEPGRPSLVLDMVEEFRSSVIDRTVISYINSGQEISIESGLLTLSTRKNFSEKVLEKLENEVYYNGKKFMLKSVIQIQARNLAKFLRENIAYKSFVLKW